MTTKCEGENPMKAQTLLGLYFLFLVAWGCGSSPVKSENRSPASSQTDSISVSPASAAAGSADLVLSITGSNFSGTRHNFSQAVWSSNGSQTLLATTFVSGTQLTAVVPAALLISPVSAQVFVQTGDPMGDVPLRKSVVAGFSVTALPVGLATIRSISPAGASSGSSDLTLTISGTNFSDERFHTSIVGWFTNDPTDTECCNLWLNTTFVSSSQLVAVIPAALLKSPGNARVFVVTGDPQGISDGVSYPRSNSVTFTVTP